ncbi:hypothetical protein SLA2020_136030 [Shorea laevis]
MSYSARRSSQKTRLRSHAVINLNGGGSGTHQGQQRKTRKRTNSLDDKEGDRIQRRSNSKCSRNPVAEDTGNSRGRARIDPVVEEGNSTGSQATAGCSASHVCIKSAARRPPTPRPPPKLTPH